MDRYTALIGDGFGVLYRQRWCARQRELGDVTGVLAPRVHSSIYPINAWPSHTLEAVSTWESSPMSVFILRCRRGRFAREAEWHPVWLELLH
jgi:hypothetical protein